MKKFIYFLFILITIGMVSSCGDDKDDVKGSSIVGTWECNYYDDGVQEHVTITFTSDGSFTLKDLIKEDGEIDYAEIFGTYDYFSEQSILRLKGIYDDGESYSGSFSCMISGNKMILEDEGETLTFTRQ